MIAATAEEWEAVMKRIALLAALVLGAAIASALVGTARSAAAADPVPAWLAPSCSSVVEGPLDRISDDIWENEQDCSSDTTPTVVCVDSATLTIWTDDSPASIAAGESDLTSMLADIRANGHSAALGACAPPSAPKNTPPREAYCSVAGNTDPFTGDPIPAGTFLDLLAGQANTDRHYTGDVPAWYVQGVGLTCSLTPAQASLAAASTQRVGAAGDPEIPIPGIPDYAIYTFVPAG
jgi:hypothetical protein